MAQLVYYNIKYIKEDGFIKFQMFNKNNKFVTNLRYFSENNFDEKNALYCPPRKIVDCLISDYRYVTSYRSDCQ